MELLISLAIGVGIALSAWALLAIGWPSKFYPTKSGLRARWAWLLALVASDIGLFFLAIHTAASLQLEATAAAVCAAVICIPLVPLIAYYAVRPYECYCNNPDCRAKVSHQNWRCRGCQALNRQSFLAFACGGCHEMVDSFLCPKCSGRQENITSLYRSGLKSFPALVTLSAPEHRGFHEDTVFRTEEIHAKQHEIAMVQLQHQLEQFSREFNRERKESEGLSRDERFLRFADAKAGLHIFYQRKKADIEKKFYEDPVLRAQLMEILDQFIRSESVNEVM